MTSSSLPPLILSATFPPNPYRFVFVGSPLIQRLQTLGKAYPNSALPLPSPIPIVLKKKNLANDEDRGEIVETVYLRPQIDTLYLPMLETLDIEHFTETRGNHALRQIALLVSDIESVYVSPAPLSQAAQIIFGLPQLETVYAVECSAVGKERSQMLSFREECPNRDWEMLEVPEVQMGPPPGDAMDIFNGYTYPSHPWSKEREVLVKKHWEEQMVKKEGSKPRLECRFLKMRLPART